MRVLVTRPEPGTSDTARILNDRGHEPVSMPLTSALPLKPDRSDLDAVRAGAYAVTSANAIRAWQALGIDSACLGRPLYAVGERTGELARQAGFDDVRIGAGDGAGLAEKLLADIKSADLSLSSAAPLVYAAGKVRHSRFEDVLAAENTPISVVELYEIEKISYSTDFIFELFSGKEPDAVLLYSRKASELFFQTVDNYDVGKYLKKCRFICISKNVASAVPSRFQRQIAIAAHPDEQNLLALLDRSDNLF